MTNSVVTSSKRINRVLHHFNPPYQRQAHKTMANLGRESMVIERTKGCRLKHIEYGATMNYSFLALKCSPPSMHPRGSIYSSSLGNEGSIQSVSRHMEGQESSYSGLIEENSKYFTFCAHFLMYKGYSGETCVYTWILR